MPNSLKNKALFIPGIFRKLSVFGKWHFLFFLLYGGYGCNDNQNNTKINADTSMKRNFRLVSEQANIAQEEETEQAQFYTQPLVFHSIKRVSKKKKKFQLIFTNSRKQNVLFYHDEKKDGALRYPFIIKEKGRIIANPEMKHVKFSITYFTQLKDDKTCNKIKYIKVFEEDIYHRKKLPQRVLAIDELLTECRGMYDITKWDKIKPHNEPAILHDSIFPSKCKKQIYKTFIGWDSCKTGDAEEKEADDSLFKRYFKNYTVKFEGLTAFTYLFNSLEFKHHPIKRNCKKDFIKSVLGEPLKSSDDVLIYPRLVDEEHLEMFELPDSVNYTEAFYFYFKRGRLIGCCIKEYSFCEETED